MKKNSKYFNRNVLIFFLVLVLGGTGCVTPVFSDPGEVAKEVSSDVGALAAVDTPSDSVDFTKDQEPANSDKVAKPDAPAKSEHIADAGTSDDLHTSGATDMSIKSAKVQMPDTSAMTGTPKSPSKVKKSEVFGHVAVSGVTEPPQNDSRADGSEPPQQPGDADASDGLDESNDFDDPDDFDDLDELDESDDPTESGETDDPEQKTQTDGLDELDTSSGSALSGDDLMNAGIAPLSTQVLIQFNPNGGTPKPQDMYSEIGKTISQPNVTRTGYTLTGWYNGGAKWNFSTDTVKGAMTLTAQWTDARNKQDVTFIFNNCQPMANQTVQATQGGSFAYPSATAQFVSDSNGGAWFSSWYRDAAFINSFSGEAYSETTSKNVNLYARYRRYVVFSYYNASNSNTSSQYSFYADQTASTTIAFPSYSPVKYVPQTVTASDGSTSNIMVQHTFEGWYKEAGYTNRFTGSNASGLTYNSSGDAYLYARYVAPASVTSYTATLNYNDDAKNVVTLTVPENSRLPNLPTPVLSGTEFVGWYNNNTPWQATSTVTGNITLDARHECTITYALNGGVIDGQSSLPDTKVIYGERLKDPGTPVRLPDPFNPDEEPAKFVMWVSSTGVPVTFAADGYSNDPITCSQTLIAVFDDEPDPELLKVRYDVNGGAPVFNAVQLVAKGKTFKCLPTTTRNNYVLDGWYYGDKKWDFNTDTAEQDMMLTAKWLTTYNVYFKVYDANSTTVSTTFRALTVTENNLIPEVDKPLRTDSRFLGWEYITGTDRILWDFDSPLTSAYVTSGGFYLYAKYESYPKVTLNYNNGSNYSITQPVYEKDGSYYFHFPEDPKRYGYNFTGWYNGTDKYTVDTAIYADITLTAEWNEADLKITFDPNKAGFSSQYITSSIGRKILPVVFAKDTADNTVIVSWHRDVDIMSEAVDFNDYIVQGDDTLYAKWGSTTNIAIKFINVYEETIKVGSKDDLTLPYASVLNESQTPPVSDPRFYFQNEWLFDGIPWDFNVAFTSDITLVASVKHRVTLDKQGGAGGVNFVDVSRGTSFYEPETPVRVGFAFKGWYKDMLLTEKWKFIGDVANADIVMSNMTLYAKWSNNVPPEISPIGDYSEYCGRSRSIPVVASDDGQIGPLVYTIEMRDGASVPGSVAWDDVNKAVVFSPMPAEAGNVYQLKMTVSDGELSSYQYFSLTAVLPSGGIAISIDEAEVSSKIYDGTDAAVVTNVTLSGMATYYPLIRDIDYTVSARFNDVNAADAVPATLTLTLLNTTEASVYYVVGSYSTAAAIYKADGLTITVPSIVVKAGVLTEGALDLDELELNKSDYGSKDFTFVDITGSAIFTEIPQVSEGSLIYKVNPADQDIESEIMLQLTTQNYLDIDVNIPFIVVKDPVTPSSGSKNKKPALIQAETPAEIPIPEPIITEAPYISGYPDGTLRPNQFITRAETAQIIYNLYGEDEVAEIETLSVFTDGDQPEWCGVAQAWSVEQSYFDGYGDGSIRFDKEITRAELATILFKIAERIGKITEGVGISFGDTNNHWASYYIDEIVSSNIMDGQGSYFEPDTYISRAETVEIMAKLAGRSQEYNTSREYSDLPATFWAYSYMMNAANGN